MKANNTDWVKKEFLEIRRAMNGVGDEEIMSGKENRFAPFVKTLNRLAAEDVEDDVARELLRDPEFKSAVYDVSHMKRISSLRMEIERTNSIINAKDPWKALEGFIYYPNYLELGRMERRGGGLKKGDMVVFLGSGPLPLTLISLYKQFGIKGVGLEQDPRWVNLSQRLIDALSLSGHIRIMEGNHFSLPLVEECALTMVGADALPKDEIFKHLAMSLPEGAKLSFRIYEKGFRRLLDNQSVFRVPDSFREELRIRPAPPVNNTSVFLVKREQIRK